jgi:hypothetical protein
MKVKFSFNSQFWISNKKSYPEPKNTKNLIGFLPFDFIPENGLMFSNSFLDTIDGIDRNDDEFGYSWDALVWTVDFVEICVFENNPIVHVWMIGN